MKFLNAGIILAIEFSCFYFSPTQLCFYSTTQVSPIDLSKYQTSTYVNIYLYFKSPNVTITNIRPTFSSKFIIFSGDFGHAILDGNVNYVHDEQKIRFYYNCLEMRLFSPSLNKFWGGKLSDFELMVKCTLISSTDRNYSQQLHDTIILSFSVVNIPSEQYGKEDIFFFTSFVNQAKPLFNQSHPVRPNSQDLIFNITGFDLGSIFLEESEMNNYSQFYFYSGNDVIECDDSYVTWIMFNNLLKISDDNSNFLKSLLESLEMDVSKEVEEYYKDKNSSTIEIFRNFYFNSNQEAFERLMMDYAAEGKSTFLKTISKMLLIILILVSFD